MNKTKFLSLTASLVLAITFTLSCEDKEKDKPATVADTASTAETATPATPPETAEKTVPDKRETFTDSRDGKTYKKVTIGTQTWMAENLNYGYMYYSLYGAKEACPAGWHLPSDKEWTTLVNYAGGEKIAGKKLKAKTGWKENGNGTDDYGFSALPDGQKLGCEDGPCFWGIDEFGTWLSATEMEDDSYWCYTIGEGMNRGHCNAVEGEFNNGYTIRCIQD